jgi:hypothetical protein
VTSYLKSFYDFTQVHYSFFILLSLESPALPLEADVLFLLLTLPDVFEAGVGLRLLLRFSVQIEFEFEFCATVEFDPFVDPF